MKMQLFVEEARKCLWFLTGSSVMRSWFHVFTTLLLAAAVAGAVVQFSPQGASTPIRESAYDRIMRTGTLRCGYYSYPPEIIVDANTRQISGWAHDIVERVGQELGLKVEWVEEITLDTIYEGVNAGRFDALCSTLWESPQRSKHVLFTQNVVYPTYYPFVRADDHRFDANLQRINAPDVKVAIMDGEYGQVVANEFFANAKQDALPRGTMYSMIFEEVAHRKADVVFAVPSTGQLYMKGNPGVLRMLNREVVVMPASVMMLRSDEIKLKQLLDSTLRHLLNRGVVRDIIAKYHPGDKITNYPVAKPYVQPE